MRVWGIAAQNDSLFQYLTDKFKVINESDSVFHEDVNNLMILYYGYAYRDSYGHMPVTEIKINQLLQLSTYAKRPSNRLPHLPIS